MTKLEISFNEADFILTWLEVAEEQHLGIKDQFDRDLLLKIFKTFDSLARKHPMLAKIAKEEKITTDEEVLMKHGWTVECQSPFEIRHWDGSFASRQAASLMLEYIKKQKQTEEYESY